MLSISNKQWKKVFVCEKTLVVYNIQGIPTFHFGIWYDGTWTSGFWNSGVWLSGIWIEGAITKDIHYNRRTSTDISPKSYYKPKNTLSLNYAKYNQPMVDKRLGCR